MDEKITHRRRTTAVAGLLLAIGAVVGCGSTVTTASGSAVSPSPTASATPSASPSPTATPTPEPSPSGPGIAVGEPAPVKLPAIAQQAQGTTLTVWFYGGVCDKYGLKVDESKKGEVDVRIVITELAKKGQECPALAKRNEVKAQLSHPLEGRKVIDSATGQELPLDPGPPGGPQ